MTATTLSEKLLKIQKNIGAVTKSSTNPHFKSKYADLNEVYEVAKPALNAEDILILHRAGKDEHGAFMTTEFVSGSEVIASKVYLSGSEENMQKVGAANTYAKRQGLKALLAMEEADDDGEAAVGRGSGKSVGVKEGPQTTKAAPVAAKVSEQPKQEDKDRSALNALIRQTGKVLADMKKQPLEDTAKLVKSFGVKSTEELTDDQAKNVLAKLKEVLNAKA